MTTLYRTPNIIVDNHEWHIVVQISGGRTTRTLRWRPLSLRAYAWANISTWAGKTPSTLIARFAPYKRHIELALGSEARRKEHADALRVGRSLPVPEREGHCPRRGPRKAVLARAAQRDAEVAARFAMARETLALRV